MKDEEILGLLRPYVAGWFRKTFGTFTEPQRKAIPLIKRGSHVLISSPTGTGKTLAAFLGILDELYRIGEDDGLEDMVYVVYVSPLRALNNDMRRNLFQPLNGIKEEAEKEGLSIPEIRVAVRTGDTSPQERQAMLRKPPHILITTPESLAIVLVAPKFRLKLSRVRWVIVDEIHELATSKRGTMLSLLLERLEHLSTNKIQRIGLSATIAPLERIARFLGGYENGEPRKVRIVDARFKKPIDIRVLTPAEDLVYTETERLNESIYRLLYELIKKHRSTLIFTNTRSSTERVVYKLRRLMEKDKLVEINDIEAHHGSLSRHLRLDVEERLKRGELKAVVCVSPDTMVYTESDAVRIDSLEGKEKIIGVDGGRARAVSYREAHQIEYDGRGLRIETSLGYRLEATMEHMLLSLSEDGSPVWRKASELRAGDFVAVLRRLQKTNIHNAGKPGGCVRAGNAEEAEKIKFAFLNNGILPRIIHDGEEYIVCPEARETGERGEEHLPSYLDRLVKEIRMKTSGEKSASLSEPSREDSVNKNGNLQHALRELAEKAVSKALSSGDRELYRKALLLKWHLESDLYFDKIKKIEEARLEKAYGIIDSETGTFVTNGFVSKNSSTSLELGIDIGYIDLVVLLSSPKSVSRLLQRVGRAGHKLHDVSKGRIIVVNRDDLVECTVLAEAARRRLIDKAKIPEKPLDVLAQNIVAMSLEKRWSVQEAYDVIRRAYPYRKLSMRELEEILEYLGGKSGELEELRVYRKIWYDPVEGVFGRKRGVRMIYYLNQGTIPDEAKIRVYLKNRRYIGDLDEGFAQILSPGDIFVLGGRTYRYIRIKGNRITVEDAEGQRPTVPSWFSEMLPLAFDSALLVGAFRRNIAVLLEKNGGAFSEDMVNRLASEYQLQRQAAREILRYLSEQYAFTGGIIANDKLLHIEIYDDSFSRNIIFHSLFGRRTNDALSRAYASIVTREYGFPVRITVSDNAFMLTLSGHPNIDVRGIVGKLKATNIEDYLKKALWNTELMKRRFRHCAQRSFMILRNYKGWERSPNRMQLNAQALLDALKENPDHPIVRETLREIMQDYMDVDSAKKVLRWIEKGEIKVEVTGPSTIPSPFAHHILSIGYHDIVLMEDKRRLIMELHRRVMDYLRRRGYGLP